MARATLEQWRMLRAVVEHGGFAQAAAAIHKSQSSINHAVHKLQDQLGLELLEVVGRKARLTDAGRLVLRRAGQLLDQAEALEDVAASLSAGTEAEVRLAVDAIFPPDLLADTLAVLALEYPHTRVEVLETVLSGGAESLSTGEADLLVSQQLPEGVLGELLLRTEFVAVAHPAHPLHGLGRSVYYQDLAAQRQIVVRDSARGRRIDAGWLGAEQRWTVSALATSIAMIRRGMGFAWLPRTRVERYLADGSLRELPLEHGGRRPAALQLAFADSGRAGPATRRLAGLLREASANLSI
jgi:DNA-binding transcriptional LysR family regulator